MTSFVKIRIVLVIFIAIILSYTAYMILQSWKTEVDVVVAAIEIPELTIITPDMLRIEKVTLSFRDSLAPRSVPTKDRLENKLAKVNIPAGRPIDSVYDVVTVDGTKLTTDEYGNPNLNEGVSESYILERSERLVAVPVDKESTFTVREANTQTGASGTVVTTKLKKGDLVDVLATYTNENNFQSSVLIAQKVLVHQVEAPSEDGSEESMIVTFRTIPDIAADIAFMKNVGTIDLIMSSVEAIPSGTRELSISKVIDRSNAR